MTLKAFLSSPFHVLALLNLFLLACASCIVWVQFGPLASALFVSLFLVLLFVYLYYKGRPTGPEDL